MSRRTYITNAIPYVNGDPHIGHALEFVQTDVIARHRRLRGESVRYLSGTDDNAFKNVRAAEAAGGPVPGFVAERAHAFAPPREPLQLSYDDFIRTSTDRRHRPGVERLWNACRAAGDLYEREYSGLYCAGCEAFVSADDLEDGLCVEHGVPPETVTERNWFFALSRYRDLLLGLLESGQLDVRPAHRRNEVLSLVRGGLEDFSVSRPAERAHGWGIPVPGDAGQVIYVWFDALANYIPALGYGQRAEPYATWWEGADDRVHLVGKGITRFHAVYWPAILLSAGEPLPTTVVVHDYLTVEGRKISKSAGTSAHPATLVDRYGGDALRWWLLRDVPPSGDADFREHQLGLRANELADGLGNLVNRTIALSGKYDPDLGAPLAGGDQRAAQLELLAAGLPGAIDQALARFDLRAASGALWDVVNAANAYVSHSRPWELGRATRDDARAGALLDSSLALLDRTCRRVARELAPFLPAAGRRLVEALDSRDTDLGKALFPKVDAERPHAGPSLSRST